MGLRFLIIFESRNIERERERAEFPIKPFISTGWLVGVQWRAAIRRCLTFNVTDPKSYSLLYRSSTVARYLSVYVLNRNRLTMQLLPTPAPPKITSRIRSKSAIASGMGVTLLLVAASWPSLLMLDACEGVVEPFFCRCDGELSGLCCWMMVAAFTTTFLNQLLYFRYGLEKKKKMQ